MKNIIQLILFSCLLQGCLKDEDTLKVNSNVDRLISEFPLGDSATLNSLAIPLIPGMNVVDITEVQVHPRVPLKENIDVTITVNQALIDAYNLENGTSYEAPPSYVFELVTPTYTLSPQNQKVPVKALINAPELIDNQYAIGLTIISTTEGEISQNRKDILIELQAKNEYDGIYKILSGNVQRYTAPGVPSVNDPLNGSVEGNPDLVFTTVGANTIEITNLRWSGGTSSVGGIANLRLTVDPATNEVTMESIENPTLGNWEGMENSYDPSTRTFTVNFRWNPTANRREYSMVVQWIAPR
jgi:hypothetical protein